MNVATATESKEEVIALLMEYSDTAKNDGTQGQPSEASMKIRGKEFGDVLNKEGKV